MRLIVLMCAFSRRDFATVWMNLGIVQSALKQYEESEASYFTALQYQPIYPACYYNLGVLVSINHT